MILSHSHRFVFIKTRKTAGSSLEIGLSRACDPDDVITPLSAKRGEEALRRQEGGVGPVNHHKPILAHRGLKEWRRLALRGQRAEFGPHTTALEIRRYFGDDLWTRYYRFTVERNPWDRAVSRYWWQKLRWEERGRSNFPKLSEYLVWMARNKPHWISNWGHYAVGNTIVVDRVLRYENLSADLASLAAELGVKSDISLPARRAKSGYRQDKRHYSEILTRADRALIDRLCHREIAELGYEFEGG